MTLDPQPSPSSLSPTTLSQYIRLDNCERFLRFRLAPEDLERLRRKWNLTLQPLTPLLKESGAEFEADMAARLAERREKFIDLSGKDVAETLRLLQEVEKPTLLYQPALEAPIGDFLCSGQADLLHLHRDRQGSLHVLVADIKATRQEKTEHRLQVAVYARLVQNLAALHGISLGSLSGAVLTRQEDGGFPGLGAGARRSFVQSLSTFDLDPYFGILDRLVVDPDATIRRVLAEPFDAAFYHLGPKCDGCLYNAVCMFDSAERLDLALTPGITPVEKRILLENGVCSLKDLAALMDLPAPNQRELRPAPQHAATLEKLRNRWPVAPDLPFLVQRARAALHHFDSQIDYRPFLFGSGFGGLPSDSVYPELVKIFFDAQRDYLQDRIYLLSACVVGPRGEETVVECAAEPPTAEIERDLLLRWVEGVISAIGRAAKDEHAPLHLYCYNRYDQKALLEALKRNLPVVAAVPAFFDLMTQNAALSQPMVSFLADEFQERLNPGRACLPLHDAARWRGFDWKDDRYEYFRLFQARMFDNRRDVLRRPDGSLAVAGAKTAANDAGRLSIEAASRFNSQVPLEYAYAAWGRLPADPQNPHLLAPFRQVTLDMLRGFARLRAQALAHIEASFRSKSKYVEKKALELPRLLDAVKTYDLRQSLKEFLYMEHHTALQANLLAYAAPIERRVQNGTALLLSLKYCSGENFAVFTPELGSIGLDPATALSSCKLKEGDWVVFNPCDPALTPNQIKHGRLSVIESIDPEGVTLELLGSNFHNGDFRYSHHYNLEPRSSVRYTIDPMADDLNADKVLHALDHVQSNCFFEWLLHRPRPRSVRPQALEFIARFADYVSDLVKNRGRKLTGPQRDAIAGHLADALILIQGPPGTGKSYTLAWAVLAHIAACTVEGRPCRVLISCKTHNAIRVALDALVAAQAQVGVFAPSQFGGQGIFGVEIYKVSGEASEKLPSGVRALNVYDARYNLENVLARRFLIIGATSGGAYNLMRYRASNGKEVDWESKLFDLVVIDEASQMSLPEGVLAGAFLKPGGRMIAVGDHRQMPPIIAHDWKEEQKRSVSEARPFISLFEALIERGFPVVRLDESFRLHRDIAEFLRENIYSKDGIRFHSKRRELMPRLPGLSPYVDAVLDPAYPIVVIEHDESASQQLNPLELALARPLIQACIQHLSLDGRRGIGVVVPHRAQKALLRQEFPSLAEVNSIDTVERFQGDERDVIIVSATASDPDYVRGEADFLLNLNRLNVAISRPRKKLIVIAARSVVDLLTSDLNVFEQSLIWKRLYHHYTPEILLQTDLNGHTITVRGRRAS